MKTTIDAMKQALEAITIASLRCVSEAETCTVLAANAALREAIAHEEAQTVEPVTTGYVHPVPDKCDRITWRNRYYHLPAFKEDVTPPSGELGTFEERVALRAWQASSGKRDAIEGLRTWAGITEREAMEQELQVSANLLELGQGDDWKTELIIDLRKAADMLAADALLEAKAGHRGRDAGIAEVARHNAQQGAVPQGLEVELIKECERAMAQRDKFLKTEVSTASHGGSHDTCFGVILRKYLSAPPPPQAERVPMTDGEIDGILRTVYAAGNHGRSLEHAFARAIEAHHKIGVK